MPEPVTIAIPFFKGFAYLQEAVDSVLSQNVPEWQLIVVDDRGSDDDVGGWLETLDDPRIRFIRNPNNLGMVGAWNTCLDAAATDRVTLLHADDRLGSSYVALVHELNGSHTGAVGLFCDARIIDATGDPSFSLADRVKPFFRPASDGVYPVAGESGLGSVARGNYIMCPTISWSRDLLAGRRFDPRWNQVQDLALTSRLLLEGERFVGSTTKAYEYRRHGDAATAQQSESMLRFHEEMELLDEIADGAASIGWHRAARSARRRDAVRLHLLHRALTDTARLRRARAVEEFRMAFRRPRSNRPGTRGVSSD